MKYSLGFSNFLEEISSLSYSIVFLYFFFALIAEERRDAKGTGVKESYTHLNAEFQRIARRDKKAFLGDQCKEIEESNKMGKPKDLFKKIRDTKGIFHAKMGTIKDRNEPNRRRRY